MQEYVNKYGKTALYIIGGLLLMYLMIYIFTPKQEIPLKYKHALDSLDRANAELVAKQKQSDSLLQSYQDKVNEVDFKIDNIKEKTTIVREYYHERIKEVDNYNTEQIENFFKQRYQ